MTTADLGRRLAITLGAVIAALVPFATAADAASSAAPTAVLRLCAGGNRADITARGPARFTTFVADGTCNTFTVPAGTYRVRVNLPYAPYYGAVLRPDPGFSRTVVRTSSATTGTNSPSVEITLVPGGAAKVTFCFTADD